MEDMCINILNILKYGLKICIIITNTFTNISEKYINMLDMCINIENIYSNIEFL